VLELEALTLQWLQVLPGGERVEQPATERARNPGDRSQPVVVSGKDRSRRRQQLRQLAEESGESLLLAVGVGAEHG
jgi:hypothetical protein